MTIKCRGAWENKWHANFQTLLFTKQESLKNIKKARKNNLNKQTKNSATSYIGTNCHFRVTADQKRIKVFYL